MTSCSLILRAGLIVLASVCPCRAGVIVVNDLTDQLSVSASDPTRMPPPEIGVGFEGLTQHILAPAGTTLVSYMIYNGVTVLPNAGIFPGFVLLVAEPEQRDQVSDIVNLDVGSGATEVILGFQSDSEIGLFPPCAEFRSCQIIEDGTQQFAYALNWSNGTVDTIRFQSDAVPEPTNMTLLNSLVVGLGLAIRTRKISASLGCASQWSRRQRLGR